jgi:germination protein YpeB
LEKSHFFTRKKARIILFTSSLVIVLLIFSIVQTVKANKYEQEATLSKQMALTSLDENLNNISTNLEKTIYVSTPTMLTKLSAELWREASSAKTCLSMLPTGENAISNTYKFLSQVGEFVMSLERKSALGEKLTDKEREQLKNLYSFCNDLNAQINQMCRDMQNGNFSFEEINSTIMNNNSELKIASQGFEDTEQTMTDLPTLIYDGPFSDHLTQSEPKYLKNLEKISKEKALEFAKNICISEKDNLIFSHEDDGDIPCYVFKGKNCTIAITKQGGKPCYMLSSEFSGETKIKYSEAIRNAESFLKKIGYKNMKESYYYTDDGICTINFAATKNGVVMYPDLIKVSVCLEKGNVLSFDASGYISNHIERDSLNVSLSKEQAENILNNHLEIIDTQLCVIPTEWATEQLCYEIHCKTDNGQDLLIYIDCSTGEEDNILILLYSDGGVLTK